VSKDFGKTKIFLPNQSAKEVLDKTDFDTKTARLAELCKQLQDEQTVCKQLDQGKSMRRCHVVLLMNARTALLGSGK
jgi:hypothetical protein